MFDKDTTFYPVWFSGIKSDNIGLLKLVKRGEFVYKNSTSPIVVKNFVMSIHEITQAQFEAITGKNPSYFANPDNSRLAGNPRNNGKEPSAFVGFTRSDAKDRPVESITFFDAIQFCNALSSKEGLEKVYTVLGSFVSKDEKANGYRLPTEDEWMWAAMERKKENASKAFSGTGSLGNSTWYRTNAYEISATDIWANFQTQDFGTKKVGTKTANALGIYDLSGNVWEWCDNWYGSRGGSASEKVYRVCKGGSFHSKEQFLNLDYRKPVAPNYASKLIGMRVVRSYVEK